MDLLQKNWPVRILQKYQGLERQRKFKETKGTWQLKAKCDLVLGSKPENKTTFSLALKDISGIIGKM